MPTWWCLHFPGPGAPLEAGSGPLLGVGEALPDVLLATSLPAWHQWRLGESGERAQLTSALEAL